MPFEKIDTQVDFPALERNILEFWRKTDAFDKLRQQNRGKPPWSFLDGPITANNPMGVHHAWGRTYKDIYQRYFAMTGHELRYQNGFDCQGLWVEVEVEKEKQLRSKRDIENLVPGNPFASIDRFVEDCKNRVDKFARIQTEQSIRLGYWMDWDRPEDFAKPPDQRRSYYTMSEENNYTIWSFLKKCSGRGLIYRGYDAMPWCARCAVGLSQMEMHEGYQMVAHRSVFVKFPLRGVATSVPLVADAQRTAGTSGVAGGEQRTGGTPSATDAAELGRIAAQRAKPIMLQRLREAEGATERATGGTPVATKENLLVWTTTPWTLSSNVAAAVNAELTYLKIKHKDEIYYIAKGALTVQRLEEQFKRKEWVEGVPKLKTLEQIFKEKGGYEILGELSGKDLVGLSYDGPFDELAAQNHPAGYPAATADIVLKQGWGPKESARNIHRVVAWNLVGEAEGTGIVHIAPGAGKEDFLLGKEQKLVPIAPLDDYGVFLPGFGDLAGKSALDHATTDWILANLQEKGRLFAVEKYPHSYPHCWRCKTELLFRLVDEWFINMDWRGEIMKIVEDVTFLPESINGKARELDWLRNMGDWMISKKRFWGLALPIWVDDKTGEFEVIGSRQELKERAVEGWDRFEGHSPHRPWIDLVKIRNPRTGNLMSRIPDVGNPWLDAGIVPFSTMKYNSDRAYWEKWFPADFITESFPGQFRNWFYAILAMSTMMVNRGPFKVLLGHAQVRDEHGEEMHKAKGNSIPFEGAADSGYELTDKKTGKKVLHPPMSADLIRWMYCRQNPALNINFGPGLADELRSKFTLKLWNTYAFFCNYARLDGFDPSAAQVPVRDRPDIDRWILSDLQLLIRKARESFEKFNVQAFCLEAESFVDDKLSNWYVRRNRRRFWKSEQGTDKLAAYQTLYAVLVTLSRLIAPVMPFLSEMLHRNLGTDVKRWAESVHHASYPEVDDALIDTGLSTDMEALLRLVSLGSAARNTVKIKVRQPLAELRIQPASDAERRAVERFSDQICEELNIKRVTLHDAARGSLLQYDVKPNPKNLGPKLGPRLKDAAAALAKMDPAVVAAKVQAGQTIELAFADGPVTLEPTDLFVVPKTEAGWAGLAERGTQVLLDARISPELAQEGLAREVIRHAQNARKDAGLEMEDRIVLFLTMGDELGEAIRTHRQHIASECLVADWAKGPLGEGAYRTEVKIEGQPLTIELKKK